MEFWFALACGAMYSAAFFLLLRRGIVQIVIGLILLSHAANLLIFTCGRLVPGRLPLVVEGSTVPEFPIPDPVPQALILTAIVISFGILAFALVLIYRSAEVIGTDDSDKMSASDT